ncbi:MAG: hypothetical protein DMG70_22780 [Acidobacteria bacterium]|nr:MAG: hypothetical protein DMG70_22780 [Acidobacteriota bacterium]PYY07254.1 MAG: hypothetical protein DMG69_20380 [Acidobacteriota bacterium]
MEAKIRAGGRTRNRHVLNVPGGWEKLNSLGGWEDKRIVVYLYSESIGQFLYETWGNEVFIRAGASPLHLRAEVLVVNACRLTVSDQHNLSISFC